MIKGKAICVPSILKIIEMKENCKIYRERRFGDSTQSEKDKQKSLEIMHKLPRYDLKKN